MGARGHFRVFGRTKKKIRTIKVGELVKTQVRVPKGTEES